MTTRSYTAGGARRILSRVNAAPGAALAVALLTGLLIGLYPALLVPG